jgi:molybdopterin molybdotransferase
MSDQRPVLTADEARRRVLGSVAVLPTVQVPLVDAVGSVLRADVRTRVDQPPFDHSAMDGYAMRAADLANAPVTLPVVTVSSAGHPAPRGIQPGEAARILTGAVMVPGADCVVRIEDTDGGDDVVEVRAVASAGANVRRAAEGAASGDVVIPAGVVVHPGHLGVAAAAGVDELEVTAMPRVAVVSTGDELVPVATKELAPGQLFESNGIVIAELARAAGCDVTVRHCGDDTAVLESTVRELGAHHDLVITTGGVSMGGEYDTVRAALLGSGVEFWKLAIRPAKPFAFGRVGDAVFFGLPGNPVSAVVSFELFVRPAIRALRGISPATPPTVVGVAGEALSRPDDDQTYFVRVRRGDDGRWRSTGRLGTHLLGGIADAHGLAVLGPDLLSVSTSDELEIVPLWT